MNSFYKFTEHNEWEGETWHFYVPLTDKQLQKIEGLIADHEFYEISAEPIPEFEVDILVKHTDSNYMDNHNKCKTPAKIPDSVNFDENDIFYKGEFWPRVLK